MILGVAIRLGNHIISKHQPARHADLIREFARAGRSAVGWTQGFFNEEKFLTREEAEAHARACGQLTGPLIGSVLTSEDLW